MRAAYFVETNLIQYPILRPVCLILKKLLVKNGHSDPYSGGLGSYSLFLMLYAAYFIEKVGTFEGFHSENTHPARLFAWFLTYFGEYFDMKTMAIMFMQEAMPLTVPKIYCGTT
jgi:DNA polymerase sigma